MSSKGKKRVVLPTRPEPPTMEQILEDVRSTQPSDPMFVLIAEVNKDLPAPGKEEDSEVKTERLYQQSHSYVQMNQRLQKVCSLLKEKCIELKQAGMTLEQNIVEIKEKAL
ncbi:UPF0449 protein C19orf25 homolog [Dermochelys coriacea]|uniref:UPF0449 protein C19orf25 homolog n=1 Tax=Dermochelys coriacea TaxID=27794 RepID=UPI0018E72DCA|nr:UPF0449 protein C19orf25 homolog [Dermochelys coriacea]XP_043358580.1 UPF0449 protein C19orf25 homolog [Dermochelys coriacea]XP_043358581.1 UPF0449 protein C19orf25 homolog [Dermochelys coriacea]